ncbi:MAG: LamG domain-containing protein [Daejeonella sp.]
MKSKTYRLLIFIAGVSLLSSSCLEKFDSQSYAPALSIGGYTSTKEIAPASLVGYWAFDGNLLDSVSKVAGDNTGTTFSKGIKGQALQGAKNSYVTFNPGNAIKNLRSFTITYWVNSPLNTNGIVGLVNLSNSSNFWGNIDMFFENGSTVDAAKFRVHISNNGNKDAWLEKDGMPNIFNKWVSFTVSYDEVTSTFKLYVNGSLSVKKEVSGYGPINFVNSGKIVFGTVHFQTSPSLTSATGSQPWASYLTGQLDEVRIYNKSLSDSEVGALVKLGGRGK